MDKVPPKFIYLCSALFWGGDIVIISEWCILCGSSGIKSGRRKGGNEAPISRHAQLTDADFSRKFDASGKGPALMTQSYQVIYNIIYKHIACATWELCVGRLWPKRPHHARGDCQLLRSLAESILCETPPTRFSWPGGCWVNWSITPPFPSVIFLIGLRCPKTRESAEVAPTRSTPLPSLLCAFSPSLCFPNRLPIPLLSRPMLAAEDRGGAAIEPGGGQKALWPPTRLSPQCAPRALGPRTPDLSLAALTASSGDLPRGVGQRGWAPRGVGTTPSSADSLGLIGGGGFFLRAVWEFFEPLPLFSPPSGVTLPPPFAVFFFWFACCDHIPFLLTRNSSGSVVSKTFLWTLGPVGKPMLQIVRAEGWGPFVFRSRLRKGFFMVLIILVETYQTVMSLMSHFGYPSRSKRFFHILHSPDAFVLTDTSRLRISEFVHFSKNGRRSVFLGREVWVVRRHGATETDFAVRLCSYLPCSRAGLFTSFRLR